MLQDHIRATTAGRCHPPLLNISLARKALLAAHRADGRRPSADDRLFQSAAFAVRLAKLPTFNPDHAPISFAVRRAASTKSSRLRGQLSVYASPFGKIARRFVAKFAADLGLVYRIAPVMAFAMRDVAHQLVARTSQRCRRVGGSMPPAMGRLRRLRPRSGRSSVVTAILGNSGGRRRRCPPSSPLWK